jgi:Zn-dependent protease with chaperone function
MNQIVFLLLVADCSRRGDAAADLHSFTIAAASQRQLLALETHNRQLATGNVPISLWPCEFCRASSLPARCISGIISG